MSQRMQALGRLWTALWQLTVGWLITVIVTSLGTIWAIVDIIWQLVSGRNDLSESSAPAMVVGDTLRWNATQMTYAFTGGGDGRWRALPM